MTCSYQAPDRWSALPEEAFAAIAPTGRVQLSVYPSFV